MIFQKILVLFLFSLFLNNNCNKSIELNSLTEYGFFYDKYLKGYYEFHNYSSSPVQIMRVFSMPGICAPSPFREGYFLIMPGKSELVGEYCTIKRESNDNILNILNGNTNRKSIGVEVKFKVIDREKFTNLSFPNSYQEKASRSLPMKYFPTKLNWNNWRNCPDSLLKNKPNFNPYQPKPKSRIWDSIAVDANLFHFQLFEKAMGFIKISNHAQYDLKLDTIIFKDNYTVTDGLVDWVEQEKVKGLCLPSKQAIAIEYHSDVLAKKYNNNKKEFFTEGYEVKGTVYFQNVNKGIPFTLRLDSTGVARQAIYDSETDTYTLTPLY